MAFRSLLSAEAQLACTALRVELGRAEPTALQDRFASALDPERLTRFCVYHGIAPSVHRGLGAAEDQAAVAPLRAALAPSVQDCAAAGLRKAEVLTTLLQRFADAGIEVLLLKGIGLDVRFYDGPGRRKDSDHDLLVRPAQVPDAVRVLKNIGFRSSKPGAPPPAQWPDTMAKHHGPPLVLPADQGPPVPVELHWAISPDTSRFPVHDPEALTQRMWDRSRSGTVLGAPVRWLAPTDEVLMLLLHAIRHLACSNVALSLRLAMLEDIARVVDDTPEVDPACLRRRARRVGPVHLLGPLRFLWRPVLGNVPPWLAGSSPEWPPAWGRRLLSVRHLLGDDATAQAHYSRARLHKARSVLVSALLLQRVSDRGRLLRRSVGTLLTPNERDYAALPFELPPGTRGLYRLVRLIRLAARLVRR